MKTHPTLRSILFLNEFIYMFALILFNFLSWRMACEPFLDRFLLFVTSDSDISREFLLNLTLIVEVRLAPVHRTPVNIFIPTSCSWARVRPNARSSFGLEKLNQPFFVF
jgi:hypothetical protein